MSESQASNEEEGESVLPVDILLHRVVHPSHVQEDRPTSLALGPASGDDGKSSVDRSDKSTAQQSFTRHVKDHEAYGVISIRHKLALEHGLKGRPDPMPTNEAHCFIDFRHIEGKNAQRNAARKLMTAARDENPWSFLPENQARSK